MTRSRHTHAARPAFTLVELLVVIAIIAILVGLISAAVVKALGAGNQTKNMADIRQLGLSVDAFKYQFKASYIPSRIKLCKFLSQYNLNPNDPTTQLDRDSVTWLNGIWPRLRWSVQGPGQNQTTYFRIDWDGVEGPGPAQVTLPTGTIGPANPKPVILDGSQCLVYFLGGIPTPANSPTPGTLGFSTDPTDPTRTDTRERVPPFYEFKSNRLVRLSSPFFYYLDSYGSKPYAYFSAYGNKRNYNPYAAFPMPPGPSGPSAPYSDCHALGVFPYAEDAGSTPRYLNPDSFQIISAGANEKFGRGTFSAAAVWTYRNAGLNSQAHWDFVPPANPDRSAGTDDQCNFHSLLLGVPAE